MKYEELIFLPNYFFSYFILSSVSNQSLDLAGNKVNITETITNIKASTTKINTDSMECTDSSSYIPPAKLPT